MVGDEYIKIRKDGRLRYYVGEVFIHKPKVSNDGPKTVRKWFRATKGFTNMTPAAECFACRGSQTGRSFWVNVVPVPTPANRTKKDKAHSKYRKERVPQTQEGAKGTSSSHLDAIAAQQKAGLDPDVRMSFIVTYVGESRANIYRKMGKEFPMPTKRGRGSFWPLSVIDAYKAKTSREGGRNGQ